MSTDTICDAIRDRTVLSIVYKDERRTIEPHIIGYDKNGTLVLKAYQTSGTGTEKWRSFHVAKIRGLSITEARFPGPRPGYTRDDPMIDRTLCSL